MRGWGRSREDCRFFWPVPLQRHVGIQGTRIWRFVLGRVCFQAFLTSPQNVDASFGSVAVQTQERPPFRCGLRTPANYTGGILNLGACESTVNGLHNYRTEAVVILDYPLSFDGARKSETVSTLCETFSEFGSTRQSTKYMGRRVSICCHSVVMSNCLQLSKFAI